MKIHSIQKTLVNEKVEIRIKTDIRIGHDRLDIFVKDKKRNLITLTKTKKSRYLTYCRNRKLRKYDLSLMHKCKVNIISYVLI